MPQRLPLLTLFIWVGSVTCQPIRHTSGISGPTIDQRVELMSISAKLAGYDEYNYDYNKPYEALIHQHFDAFRDHPLINYLRSVRGSNAIYFDAVMEMAVNLSPPPALQPLVPFSADIPDSRWGKDSAMKLARLLRQFYTDTDFEHWFRQRTEYYHQATEQFSTVLSQLDLPWYHRFYGTDPKAEFNVVLGMLNGPISYGPKVITPDGRVTFYSIVGVSDIDSAGRTIFDLRDFLPSMIHEFNHSYTNDLIDKYKDTFGAAGDTLFALAGDHIHQPNYGRWPVLISEALDRASVIRYLMSHHPTSAEAKEELTYQMSLGFIWLDQLVDLLGVYESNRKTYPTLSSFMPRIADFYQKLAPRFRALQAAYARLQPHVTSIEPFMNGDSAVDPGLGVITIHFDKPLSPGSVSFDNGEEGAEKSPVTRHLGYGPDNRSIKLEVRLKPDTEYSLVLTWQWFKTPDGHRLDDYPIQFKTSK